MDRLPKDSCLRTTPEQRLGEEYPVDVGLLALLIEVTSITAAGMQMKKPITGLTKQFSNAPSPSVKPATSGEKDQAFKRGISVLASTSKAVSRP